MRELASGLLDDLEEALRRQDNARHERLLHNLVQHFAKTSSVLGEGQVTLFDVLILRLLQEVAPPARAEVSRTLAPLETAPPDTVAALIRDHITIAAPLLVRSPSLTDDALREIARTAGQAHLLAITRRAVLTDLLTDALIARGNQSVLSSLTHNHGARFTELGFERLVASAEQDLGLQQVLARRPDLPARLFKAVVDQAGFDMRGLMAQRVSHGLEESFRALFVNGTRPPAEAANTADQNMPAAMIRVAGLAAGAGGLDEAAVAGFARAGQRLEVVCALAAMTRLPLPIVDKALSSDRHGSLLLMARALNFTFSTVRLIMRMQPDTMPARGALELLQNEFGEMTPAKARSAVGFMASSGGRDGVAAA